MPFGRKRKRYLDELAQGMAAGPDSKKVRPSTEAAPEAREDTPFPPDYYRLTPRQLRERQFPECLRSEAAGACDDGFVRTRPSGAPQWPRSGSIGFAGQVPEVRVAGCRAER